MEGRPAGRCLWRPRRSLRRRPTSGTDPSGGVLVAWSAQVLRAGGYHRSFSPQGARPGIVSPIALEAVKRIDVLFDIERTVNGLTAAERLAIRQEQSAPRIADLEIWMREQRAKLSRHDPVAKALDYMLTRWTAFTRFLGDGPICLTSNAVKRALRRLALGRRSWLFAGSDRGGQRAAFMYSLIVTAKLNDVDPQASLADVLARIAAHPVHQLDELLP